MSGGPPMFLGPRQNDVVVDVYANQIRVGATLHDFTIIFGIVEDLGNGQILNRDKATVRLAPSMVKALYLQLKTLVDAYEEAIGPLRLSEKMSSDLETIKKNLLKNYKDQMAVP